MARAKQENLAYSFRLRMTANVRRTLFVRLTDPDHHREAITSRPLLHTAIGWQTAHAGKIIEVGFQDEARVGQQGAVEYTWAPVGTRPRAVRDNRLDSVYLLDAPCAYRTAGPLSSCRRPPTKQ